MSCILKSNVILPLYYHLRRRQVIYLEGDFPSQEVSGEFAHQSLCRVLGLLHFWSSNHGKLPCRRLRPNYHLKSPENYHLTSELSSEMVAWSPFKICSCRSSNSYICLKICGMSTACWWKKQQVPWSSFFLRQISQRLSLSRSVSRYLLISHTDTKSCVCRRCSVAVEAMKRTCRFVFSVCLRSC